MSRPTLAFFDIPYRSRIVTTIAIVRGLVARGHRVVAFTLEPHRALLEEAGAVVEIQPDFGPKPRDYTVNLRTINYSMQWLPELSEQLAAHAPALVIHTAKCLWAALAAERLGLARAVIHTNALLPRGAAPSAEVHAARWPGKSDEELRMIEARDHAAWLRCAARFEVETIDTLDVLPGLPNCMNLRGDLNVVYTSDALQPLRERFDERYHFVGPCYDARPEACGPSFAAALAALPDPLIYVSLGSMQIYNDRPALFAALVEGSSARGYSLVIAAGSEERAAALDAHPRVLARAYVPQLAVLERAALFVTHAGTNSVYESLLAGVPMLMLPQGGDQPTVAEHIERLGLGVWHREGLDPAALAESCAALLDDAELGARVRAAGDSLTTAGGAERATELLSDFACAPSPPSPKDSEGP